MAQKWTDGNGITWSFTVNGTEATDIKFYCGTNPEKIYLYGDPNNSEEQPFVPGVWSFAAMRFSSTEGAHLPTIPDDVYFGLKTLIFDVSDVTNDFDMKITNGWWSNTYYDHVKWENGLNELQITEIMANECAKGGEGRDLDLILIGGSMTFNAVYYESGEVPATVVIPAKVYDGSTELNVTSIGNYAFRGCTDLTNVTIPSSVTSIGNYAFRGCTGLTNVTISEGVTSIGDGAFNGCTGLTSITLPEGLTSIGDGAFHGCTGLTSITLPEGLTSIGIEAFIFCDNLTSITIPKSLMSIGNLVFAYSGLTSVAFEEGLTSIGNYMFANCYSLTSVAIPSSVTSIGDGAFNNCTGLTSITVASGNTVYDSRNDCNAIIETATNTLITGCKNTIIPESVTSIGDRAFSLCAGLTSITLPEGLTSIGEYAFSSCGLTSVTIPSSVTSIGEYAFYWCSGLESVTSLIEEPFEISSDVFSNQDVTLYVPAGCKTKYEQTEGWNQFQNIVEKGGGEPEPYAVLSSDGQTVTFYYDDQKESRGGIDINNTWTEGSPYGTATTAVFDTSFADYRPVSTAYWFHDCSQLSTITGIGNLNTGNVTDMRYMFCRCSGLTSLDVSGFDTSNVTNMSSMFYDCSALTSLDVSGFETTNVTYMSYMFHGCSALTSLDVSGFNTSNVTNMSNMFYDCSGLTSLDVSGFNTSNVTNMSDMFSWCSGLTALNVSSFDTSNVTNMRNMFWDCSGLTSLDVSGFNTLKVTFIGGMFAGCSGLTSLDVSGFDTSNVTAMDGMFYDCSGLTSLNVDGFDTSNVTFMLQMFYGCSGLTSLDLSSFNTSNVTSMWGMFKNCTGLTTIYADEAKWSTAAVTSSDNMFTYCVSLVGGNGTVYDENHIDAEYARIDKLGQPGYFTQKEPELEPVDNADFSSDIDEDTDLDGNVVGDIYYNISSGDGSYDSSEGCIVVTTPTDDSVIDGQDIFGEDFQNNFTGIVFKVPEGKGSIKLVAQTTGSMMLKVKIGNNDPIEMALIGKLTVTVPYNVSVPTYVYIYASNIAQQAGGKRAGSANGELRLYSIEVTPDAMGILPNVNDNVNDNYYTIDGRKLQGRPTQKGVYIHNGAKVVIK